MDLGNITVILPIKLVELLLARVALIHRYVHVFQYLLKDEIEVIYEFVQYYSYVTRQTGGNAIGQGSSNTLVRARISIFA